MPCGTAFLIFSQGIKPTAMILSAASQVKPAEISVPRA